LLPAVLASPGFVLSSAPFSPTRSRLVNHCREGLKGAAGSGKAADASTVVRKTSGLPWSRESFALSNDSERRERSPRLEPAGAFWR